MRARVLIQQDTDTTLWGGAAMVLSLFAWVGASDLLMQAMICILFPCIGWTLLYFVKREIVYRFPPKMPDDLFRQLLEKYSVERDKSNSKKELE